MSVTAAAAMSAAEVMGAVGAEQGALTFAEWMAHEGFKAVAASGEAAATGTTAVVNTVYEDLLLLEETFGTQAAETAFAEWTAKSATGAATQSPVAKTAVKTAIKKAGETGGSVAGLLSMSLPAWVAAAAPVLGVAAGYGLYKSNPEFWEKVSRTLLPFCYEDTSVMPACVDEDGQTYLDKDALDALKNLFEEEIPFARAPSSSEFEPGIYTTGGMSLADVARTIKLDPGYTLPDLTPFETVTGASAWLEQAFPQLPGWGLYGGTGTITINSDGSVIVQGGTIWVRNGPSGAIDVTISAGGGTMVIPGDHISAGDNPYTPGERVYQEGTEQWTGDSVDYNTLPESERYTDITDSTKTAKIVPVALPIDPMVSNDGDLFPSPTTNSDSEAAISPYIIPDTSSQTGGDSFSDDDGTELDRVAPIPFPIPSTTSQTNPELDPSQPSEKYPPTSVTDILPNIFQSFGSNEKSPLPDSDAIFSNVAGLISVYNPTAAELIAFSRWLWVTYQDATIDKIWNNPFDGVISLHELYADPSTGSAMYIRSGFLVSDVEAATVPVRYTEIDCGTVIVPEYWNNYLDYSPYTKVFCYLPFIGIVSLEADDIIGHAVNIKYRVDAYSGACIALIECARDDYSNQIYQFSGNCSVEVPIAGGSQAAIKAGQIMASAQEHAAMSSGIAGLIGGIGSGILGAMGGSLGALGGIFSSAANAYSQKAYAEASAIQSTVTAKSSVQHSGTFGESFGAMGNKKPYLIIKRPQQVVATNYHELYGFPSHKFVVIGECTGYLRVREVHVISPTASDEEKAKIESALKTGVYVTE